MFLHTIANKISIWLTKCKIIASNDVPVYSYGLELLLSTIVNIIMLICISLLIHTPSAWLYFLISFIPLRITAGGYHASTHFRCIFVFLLFFILSFILNESLKFNRGRYFVLFNLINLISVLALSPVQSNNKFLSARNTRRNRRISIIISIAFLILCILFKSSFEQQEPAYFHFGILCASISQITGSIKKTARKEYT